MAVTISQVSDATGVAVSQATITMATSLIQVASGYLDFTVAPAEKQPWLDRAVIYQAAFIHEHPETFFEVDAVEQEFDDARVRFSTTSDLNEVLAPLARKALNQAATAVGSTATPAPVGTMPYWNFPDAPPDDHGF